MSYSKALSQIDPQNFGNWILVTEQSFANQVVDYTLSNIDGDADPKWMIELTHTGATTGRASCIWLQPNANGSISYANAHQYGGVAHGGNSDYNSTNGMVLGYTDVIRTQSSTCVINTKNTGKARQAITQAVDYITSGLVFQVGSTWPNTTSKITSLRIHSEAVTIAGCTIKIYKWTDFKPVQLHSYELVKEYNLSNQTLNDTISWDGEVDDSLYIESNISSASTATILLRLNNDLTAGHYPRGHVGQDGNPFGGGNILGDTGFIVNYVEGGSNYGRLYASLKQSNMRAYHSSMYYNIPANPDYNVFDCRGRWTDTTNKITSLTFTSQSVAVTGNIKVYKLAKTHLTCSQPGLLNGMWQKRIDNNTIEIQPGDVEIAGINHYLGSAKQITLSGNLRTGESEALSTYYYLYAIKSDSRIPTYKFSATQPTMNRFGITGIDFESADPETALYHPTEGITWRYIGQVYNDSTSNILSFDKCKPGYWEGVWWNWSNGWYNHGLGKLPKNVQVYVRQSGDTGTNLLMMAQGDSTAWKGVMLNSISNYRLYMQLSGYLYYSGATWYNTGQIKIIVKSF